MNDGASAQTLRNPLKFDRARKVHVFSTSRLMKSEGLRAATILQIP
jgi:hypothetical protein